MCKNFGYHKSAQTISRIDYITIGTLILHLKRWPDLNFPRKLTLEAKAALEIVEQIATNRHVHWIYPKVRITVFIFIINFHPTAIIGQWDTQWSDPFACLRVDVSTHQPKKTAPTIFELVTQLIIKCHQRCLQLAAKHPSKIIMPVTQEKFEWCYVNSTSLQSALQNFSRQISYHLPSHKLLQLMTTEISLKPLNSHIFLKGITVFTNRSGKMGKAIVTWQEQNEWQKLEGFENRSPQVVALHAVAMAFQCFPDTLLNIVTDSACVANITQRLDRALLKGIDNAQLFSILKGLWHTIQARDCPYCILHVRSHTSVLGFIDCREQCPRRLSSQPCLDSTTTRHVCTSKGITCLFPSRCASPAETLYVIKLRGLQHGQLLLRLPRSHSTTTAGSSSPWPKSLADLSNRCDSHSRIRKTKICACVNWHIFFGCMGYCTY